MHSSSILELLILLTLANGVPVIAKKVLNTKFSWPVDVGARFIDGRPLFGASKTWRGLLLAIAVTTVAAPLLGLEAITGLVVGGAAMFGDLFSSFVKRRLKLRSSSRAFGLDQIPESLFPALAGIRLLGLSTVDVVAVVALFLVGEIVVSRALFRLHIRDRPY